MRTVRAAKRKAVTPATIQRRRDDGAVPSPLGKRWISHSIGQPSAKPAPARGRTISMEPLSARTQRDCRLPPDARRRRDRGRGRRHDGRLGARGGGRRGDAARAGRARLRRDVEEPGPRPAAGPRRARAPVAGEHRDVHAPARRRRASSASTATRRSGRCSWPGTRASCPGLAAAPVAGEMLDGPGVAAAEPALAGGMAGGLLIDEGRRTDPGALAAAAAEAARKAGADIRTHVEVKRLGAGAVVTDAGPIPAGPGAHRGRRVDAAAGTRPWSRRPHPACAGLAGAAHPRAADPAPRDPRGRLRADARSRARLSGQPRSAGPGLAGARRRRRRPRARHPPERRRVRARRCVAVGRAPRGAGEHRRAARERRPRVRAHPRPRRTRGDGGVDRAAARSRRTASPTSAGWTSAPSCAPATAARASSPAAARPGSPPISCSAGRRSPTPAPFDPDAAARMTSTGAGTPVRSSNAAMPWPTRTSRPSTARAPRGGRRLDQRRRRRRRRGRRGRRRSCAGAMSSVPGTASAVPGTCPTGVAFTTSARALCRRPRLAPPRRARRPPRAGGRSPRRASRRRPAPSRRRGRRRRRRARARRPARHRRAPTGARRRRSSRRCRRPSAHEDGVHRPRPAGPGGELVAELEHRLLVGDRHVHAGEPGCVEAGDERGQAGRRRRRSPVYSQSRPSAR